MKASLFIPSTRAALSVSPWSIPAYTDHASLWLANNPMRIWIPSQQQLTPGIFSPSHILFMTISLMMLIGLFLIAFSKEKIEDEQISPNYGWNHCNGRSILIPSCFC